MLFFVCYPLLLTEHCLLLFNKKKSQLYQYLHIRNIFFDFDYSLVKYNNSNQRINQKI